MGDEAVQASVGGADDDGDHLAIRGAELRGGLMQLAEVGKPRAEPLRPKRIDAKDVGHEAEPLAGFGEQAPQIGRQLRLVGHREP